MDEELIISQLRRDNYCLITNEQGVELYNEQGNLIVCKAENGECMNVPNIEAVRKLYDLPHLVEDISEEENHPSKADSGEDKEGNTNLKIIIKEEDTGDGTQRLVWLGQRSQKCREATKALIEIFDSPKYQRLMSDRSTVKAKVWEKISVELQNRGFPVANTIKQAGLRTFQKWRNMERTYWRYVKGLNGDGEERRRRGSKPQFFDELHAVLTKQTKYQHRNQPENSEMPTLKGGEIDPKAIEVLLQLIDSDKYQELFDGGARKTRVWERILDDLVAMGFTIAGTTKREKSQRLFQKWRNMKRTFIKYQLSKNDKKKPAYYNLMLRLISKEMVKDPDANTNLLSPFHSSDLLEFSQLDHDYGVTQGATELYQGATINISPPAMKISSVKGNKASREGTVTAVDPINRHNTTTVPAPNIATSLKTPVFSAVSASLSNTTPSSVSAELAASNQSSTCLIDMLQQIKVLHETALKKQEQNFSEVVSLLQTQIALQQNLNSLISEYATNRKRKRKSELNSKHGTMDISKD